MSNSIEDFIISLGFDTSKVKGQIQALHKELETLAVNIDRGRVQRGLSTEREITQNTVGEVKRRTKKKLSDEQIVERQLQINHKKAIQRQQELDSIRAAKSGRSSFIESARRQQEVRALIYPEANPQLKAMGSYYKKLQADQSDMGNKSERARKRSKMSIITNSAAFRSLSNSNNPEVRKRAAEFLRQARSKVSVGKFTEIAGIKSDIQEYVKSLKKVNVQKEKTVEHDAHIVQFQKQQLKAAKAAAKIEAMRPSRSSIQSKMNAYDQKGLLPRGFSDAIFTGAMKQSSERQADQYIKASMRAAEYSNRGVGNKKDTMKIISEGNVQVLSKANMQLASMNAKMAAVERRAIGAAAAFGGMQDSARNMVREMASIYAVLAATGYAKEQVKALDSMNASVLAVSSSAEESADTIKYLKGTILQNGLSLKDTTKDFVKLRAAMQDQHSLTETKQAFDSLTKSGVILQLSQDDMSGTVKAVSQMFSKQGIYAQELKEQLGDRLPIAMRALSASTGKTSKQLFKLMETGQLGAEYILPFVMQMEKLLDVNNAYTESLKKLGVVENRMKASFSVTLAEKLDEGGFTDGLVNLYTTITDSVENNGETLLRIGKIYEKVFNGLAIVVKGATAFIESFVRVLETLWVSMKWGIENPIMGLLAALPLITLAVANLGKVMAVAFRSPMIILTTIVGLFDEIRAFFDENVDGLFDDENATNAEAAATAAQRRLLFGIGKKGDKALAGGESLVDLTGLTQFGENIGLNAADAKAWLTRNKGDTSKASAVDKALSYVLDNSLSFIYGIAKTNYDMGANDPTSFRYISAQREKQAANVTFNITSTDPKQAADETWSIFSNFFGDSTEARR